MNNVSFGSFQTCTNIVHFLGMHMPTLWVYAHGRNKILTENQDMTLNSLLGLLYKSTVVVDEYRTQAERQTPVKIWISHRQMPQCHFIYHKSYISCTNTEPGSAQCKATACSWNRCCSINKQKPASQTSLNLCLLLIRAAALTKWTTGQYLTHG